MTTQPARPPVHSCTLGALMEGHLSDDGVFYCGHGIAVGSKDGGITMIHSQEGDHR